jgi:ATP-dependent Clp endopeptidase proteolytic subunit ClpP
LIFLRRETQLAGRRGEEKFLGKLSFSEANWRLFISIKARHDGVTMKTILIYDEIRPGDARSYLSQLDGARGELTVRINSPGGAVSDGIAIYNAFARFPGHVTIVIDGLAASVSSLIAMAGEKVQMATNALLMIHSPWTLTEGDADELRDTADVLDLHAEAMVSGYAEKSGKPRAEILKIMKKETWFTAEEALAAGFIDEIVAPAEMAALARFDLSNFKHPPTSPTRNKAMPNPTNEPAPVKKADDGGKPAPALTTVASTPEEILARERQRRSEIRARFTPMLYRDGMRDLLDQVLDNPAISVEAAADLALRKLGEGTEPLNVVHARTDIEWGSNQHQADFRVAAIDALLIRGGVRVEKPHPAARDLRGASIADIGAMLIRQRGRPTGHLTRGEIIQAALTTSDLPILLENVANKSVMTGFREKEVASHRAWCREGTLSDFKTAKRVALSEAPGLEEVKEHGEYKHGALTDASEPARLDTYGRILAISRQAMINDDLGELTRTPMAMGQAAARKEADLVYAVLTSNPVMRDSVALFHANHGNLAASGGSITPATLGAARASMRVQRGLAGLSYLNLTPRFLIVPAAKETDADMIRAQITATKSADVTPQWIRDLVVIAEARLDAASTTAWYLAVDGSVHDTIEVLRLEGEPVLLETNNKFERDELQMKVRIDVGAVALDWRGLNKNPGA